jgi:multimeric flavodoxin WrbA
LGVSTNKNILILKGSPRKHGNSSVLADQVALGAQEQGANVESFRVAEMNINPCDACDTCQETHGVCVIQDDMQALYPKIQHADVLVLASPILLVHLQRSAQNLH